MRWKKKKEEKEGSYWHGISRTLESQTSTPSNKRTSARSSWTIGAANVTFVHTGTCHAMDAKPCALLRQMDANAISVPSGEVLQTKNFRRMCQTSHNRHQWEGVALAWLSNFSTSQLFQRNHCASTVAAQTSAPVPTDGLVVTTDFSCPLHNKHYACDRQAANRHVKLENPETHAENSASKSWRQNGRQERNSQGTTGGNATWFPHLGQRKLECSHSRRRKERNDHSS